jgi:hypothetical protein
VFLNLKRGGLGILLVAVPLLLGCSTHQDPTRPFGIHGSAGDSTTGLVEPADRSSWAFPLYVGMPITEIRRRFPAYRRLSMLTSASQTFPGGDVTLPGGGEATFVLGADERVRSIQTSDPGVKIAGSFGVGTRYKAAVDKLPRFREVWIPYFLRYVEVEPGMWLVFELQDPPDPDARAISIEIRSPADEPSGQ